MSTGDVIRISVDSGNRIRLQTRSNAVNTAQFLNLLEVFVLDEVCESGLVDLEGVFGGDCEGSEGRRAGGGFVGGLGFDEGGEGSGAVDGGESFVPALIGFAERGMRVEEVLDAYHVCFVENGGH